MKHLLVIRLSSLGDVAMTIPVLLALTQQHKNIKVTLVSRKHYRPLFEQIESIDFWGVDLEKKYQGWLGLCKLFLDLKKIPIDCFVDFHVVIRTKFLSTLFLLMGKKVIATHKGRKERKALTRIKNKHFFPIKSMIDRHVDTLAKLGFDIDFKNHFFLPKRKMSTTVIEVMGQKKEKWIGIAPFARYASKMYPLELMHEVINELAKKNNTKIILFGYGVKEVEQLVQFKNDHTNVVVAALYFSLRQELEIISHLDIMLSMDSGNGHLAANYGVKVITIWGATHPYGGFVPYAQPLEHYIMPDRERYPLIPTSIYGNKIVDGYEDAMRSISPETVLSVLNKHLD